MGAEGLMAGPGSGYRGIPTRVRGAEACNGHPYRGLGGGKSSRGSGLFKKRFGVK